MATTGSGGRVGTERQQDFDASQNWPYGTGQPHAKDADKEVSGNGQRREAQGNLYITRATPFPLKSVSKKHDHYVPHALERSGRG